MTRPGLHLTVPVLIEVPDQMRNAVRDVLAGEYECGFYGEDLTILDLGANVGSFSLWAHHRWPRSRIIAYEPHPQTFEMLKKNVAGLPNVECVNSAAYPTNRKTIDFFSRYPGDGESGIAESMRETFTPATTGEVFKVAVTHPKKLPAADIVKLDVEGAEAEILQHMELSGVSLILLEYQNDRNRAAIKARLAGAFELVSEDEAAWDLLIPGSTYRPDLAGEKWGHMFFVSRTNEKLTYVPTPPKKRRGFIYRALRRLAQRLP